MVMSPGSRQSPWAHTLAPLLLAIQLSLSFLTCKMRIMVNSPQRVVWYFMATPPDVLPVCGLLPGKYPGMAVGMGIPATSRVMTQCTSSLWAGKDLLMQIFSPTHPRKSNPHILPHQPLQSSCHSRLMDYPIITNVLLTQIVSGGVPVLV